MIDAVMYGMMPSANTDNLRNAPPEKRSIKPRKEPAFCRTNSSNRRASTPGVGTCCPKRYTASIASVNRIRVRRSGMRNTLAMASKNFVIGSFVKLPGGSLSGYFSLADHSGRSAGGLDLLAGGFGKHVRRHVNG